MKNFDVHVDETPDTDFPLRILRAYRERCDYLISSTSLMDGEEENPLFVEMNKLQKKRARILDKAIAKLESA
jgi:hypothetical protein